MPARLGLGTVQFGMHYGVSNRSGQPTENEISAILDHAWRSGVEYLDTAFSYPNSETLIGRNMPSASAFKIVSKTMVPEGDRLARGDKAMILDAVAMSIERLRIDRLYGVLLHRVSDLDKPGWEYLIEALEDAKARGWVERIGASVYDDGQLALVERKFRPDLVQGPFNLLDTRLLSSDCFARLKAAGTEMHVRSVFLQGLLLMAPAMLPSFFAPVRDVFSSLHARWEGEGISPLAGCLGVAMEHPDIDAVIVGVNSLAEFEEIRSAIEPRKAAAAALRDVGQPIDIKYIDPSRWPAFTQ